MEGGPGVKESQGSDRGAHENTRGPSLMGPWVAYSPDLESQSFPSKGCQGRGKGSDKGRLVSGWAEAKEAIKGKAINTFMKGN